MSNEKTDPTGLTDDNLDHVQAGGEGAWRIKPGAARDGAILQFDEADGLAPLKTGVVFEPNDEP